MNSFTSYFVGNVRREGIMWKSCLCVSNVWFSFETMKTISTNFESGIGLKICVANFLVVSIQSNTYFMKLKKIIRFSQERRVLQNNGT
jgi:hypothetical protein